MKDTLNLITQFSLLENKLMNDAADESTMRIAQRIKNIWLSQGYEYSSPIGEKYNETRTDVTANIAGDLSDNMKITQVLKPIIYFNKNIVQQGIVIVETV